MEGVSNGEYTIESGYCSVSGMDTHARPFSFKAGADARTAVVWCIESFYNRVRPHSGVG